MASSKSQDSLSLQKRLTRYVPSFLPPPMAVKSKDYEKKKDERPKEKEKRRSRNTNHFMDELKHEQKKSRLDGRPDDFDPSGKPGSFDDGDPQKRNLWGILHPGLDTKIFQHNCCSPIFTKD
ncbi:hypothetical protein AgCh_012689 [Apium graveolens]